MKHRVTPQQPIRALLLRPSLCVAGAAQVLPGACQVTLGQDTTRMVLPTDRGKKNLNGTTRWASPRAASRWRCRQSWSHRARRWKSFWLPAEGRPRRHLVNGGTGLIGRRRRGRAAGVASWGSRQGRRGCRRWSCWLADAKCVPGVIIPGAIGYRLALDMFLFQDLIARTWNRLSTWIC